MKIMAFSSINVKPLSRDKRQQINSKKDQPAFGIKFRYSNDFVEMLATIDERKANAVMEELKNLNSSYERFKGKVTLYGAQIKVASNGQIIRDMIPNAFKVDGEEYATILSKCISTAVDNMQNISLKKVKNIEPKYLRSFDLGEMPTLNRIKRLSGIQRSIDGKLEEDKISSIPIFLKDRVINEDVINIIQSSKIQLIGQIASLTDILRRSELANKVSIGIECINKYDLKIHEVPRLVIQYVHPESQYAIKESYEIPINLESTDFQKEIQKGINYLTKPFEVHDAQTEEFYKRVACFKEFFKELKRQHVTDSSAA